MAPASVALLPCRADHERDSMARRLAGRAPMSDGRWSADKLALCSLAKCRLPRRRGDESRVGRGAALHVSDANDGGSAADADRRPLGSALAASVGSRDRAGSGALAADSYRRGSYALAAGCTGANGAAAADTPVLALLLADGWWRSSMSDDGSRDSANAAVFCVWHTRQRLADGCPSAADAVVADLVLARLPTIEAGDFLADTGVDAIGQRVELVGCDWSY